MMQEQLDPRLKDSPLYSEDLAPVPASGRTWSTWSLAALWVGMAVCIPTYLLAAGMMASGISWWVSLLIIGLANVIITLPMVLNGHAGVKYGVPFPVLGRAAFGTRGIHVPAFLRALVACGWFGVQTWIGGLAIYAMWEAVMGIAPDPGLNVGKFVCFGIFWFINLYFIWNGTESIRWLENLSAPILILTGVALIVWGAMQAGGVATVLEQGKQLEKPPGAIVAISENHLELQLHPIHDLEGNIKADAYQVEYPGQAGPVTTDWIGIGSSVLMTNTGASFTLPDDADLAALKAGEAKMKFRYMRETPGTDFISTTQEVGMAQPVTLGTRIWNYLLWLTVMVGFWATMSISIADITRFARSQRDQVAGQFIGLPGTMVLYSFVGIFVTCAALINFPDILTSADAPWNPVDLLARFKDPVIVVLAQVFMLIATLTTNIAANIIAPANAFANMAPKRISFRTGGVVAALVGIVICPWWIMSEISSILLFVSGLLGPVLGVLISDYFLVRRRQLNINALFDPQGEYAYRGGFNPAALIALAAGILVALVGYFVPAVGFLYSLSWFIGFGISLLLYYVLMRRTNNSQPVI